MIPEINNSNAPGETFAPFIIMRDRNGFLINMGLLIENIETTPFEKIIEQMESTIDTHLG